MEHKAGFVNIIGNPNVGKSTLMNNLVGEKLSIITSKAQTTRHRIMGIVSGENFQIVYSDTPGILSPHYKLHEKMLKFVDRAIEDGDIILYVTDVKEQYDKHADYIEKLRNVSVPVIVAINKIDLCKENELLVLPPEWEKMLPDAHIFPLSALKGYNMPGLFDKILELLPENPPYYPKDALTDKPERFFAAEIIREKIFIHYKKEIPYSTEVQIEQFKDEESILRIKAVIYVLRQSQKGIIIGKGGEALKKIGTWARQDMEKVFGKKVFLELYVKITKDWREKENFLRSAGYNL
ncbi:MAG: GTPase Era [Bacteroidales bacterium]